MTVEGGQLVFASSSNPDHRLGPLLLRQGAISLRQMVDAGNSLSPGKRFGTVLVEAGVLGPKELVKAVIDQTRAIVLHAFEWGDGEFQLDEGAASSEAITLNISTPHGPRWDLPHRGLGPHRAGLWQSGLAVGPAGRLSQRDLLGGPPRAPVPLPRRVGGRGAVADVPAHEWTGASACRRPTEPALETTRSLGVMTLARRQGANPLALDLQPGMAIDSTCSIDEGGSQ